jgi:hypothetical protein
MAGPRALVIVHELEIAFLEAVDRDVGDGAPLQRRGL